MMNGAALMTKVPGEVDVLFSYFMAFNRAAMIEVGGFNPRALYYRNADMEYSLKIRQAGGKLLQMELPLMQERHHGYHDTDPEYPRGAVQEELRPYLG